MPNERVKNIKQEVLANNWHTLSKVTFEFLQNNGQWQSQEREAYNRGNAAVILLYNTYLKTVILTRQFRIPTYLNGNETGMMIEACAGLLDNDDPETCIKRETEEETGYKIEEVKKIYEIYMSPGSVTEKLHFFVAAYSSAMKVADGGGLAHEQEDIEVLEVDINEAIQMMENGEIMDAKTIILLQYLKLKQIM
jgi:nudix-type nucleoside diphosphatase (YffH/AdpP family)